MFALGDGLFKGDGCIGGQSACVSTRTTLHLCQSCLTAFQPAAGIAQGFQRRYFLRLQLVLRCNLLTQRAGLPHNRRLHRRHDGAQVDIILTLPRLHHEQISWLPGHLLKRSVEAQDWLALRIQLRLLGILTARDDRDARRGRINLGLCRVNFRGQHRALGNEAVGCAVGVACLLPEQFAALIGAQCTFFRCAERPLLRVVGNSVLRHQAASNGQWGQSQCCEGEPEPHPPTLHDDRGGWQ